jgi:hypothetical protein
MAIDIAALFEKHAGEYLEYERIATPLPSRRLDLCAFLLLDRLAPSDAPKDLIHAVAHDLFFLDVDMAALAEAASEDDIIFLRRLGVRYDSDYDSLCMFV